MNEDELDSEVLDTVATLYEMGEAKNGRLVSSLWSDRRRYRHIIETIAYWDLQNSEALTVERAVSLCRDFLLIEEGE